VKPADLPRDAARVRYALDTGPFRRKGEMVVDL